MEFNKTQAQLAEALGVTRGRVGQLENGWPWTAAQVYIAATWMQCTVADLMMEDALTSEERGVIAAARRRDHMGAMAGLMKLLGGGS